MSGIDELRAVKRNVLTPDSAAPPSLAVDAAPAAPAADSRPVETVAAYRDEVPPPPSASASRRVALQMIAGAGSGAVTKTAVAPLERLKILYQVQHMLYLKGGATKKYTSIMSSLRTIFKEEGFIGFYRGNGANVVRVVPVYALKFMFNDFFKDLVRGKTHNTHLNTTQLMVSGTLAGLFQQSVTFPLEFVRTRLSLARAAAGPPLYTGIMDCMMKTVRTEGFSALYKGFGPTLLSGAPYVGLQMTAYELVKRIVPTSYETGEPTLFWRLTSGAVAGLIAQSVTYPGDTIRRRMITNGMGGEARVYRNSWHCLVQIIRVEGMRGVFAGFSTNLVRCMPGAAIQFAAYEYFKKLLRV